MRLLLASVLLALPVMVQADTFTVGEETGFKGVYCKHQEPAERVAEALAADMEAGRMVYQSERWCVIAQAPITIVRAVKTYGEYHVTEVETPDGERHYIVSKIRTVEGVEA